jgi:hypothetical protein
MGVAAGHDATNATEVVELMSSTGHVDGATFVNLVPDRAKQPTLKTASGFIAGRCTYLSTVFKYDSAAGTDKKHASSLTMFENAGIGVGKTITYEQLLGSLDKDGGLRTLLADGFRSTQAVPVAEDTHAYTAVTTACPSMVSSFASPLPSEAELTRLAHVLKEEFKHRPVARTKAMQPATGRVAPTPEMSKLFHCTKPNCRKKFIKEKAFAKHVSKCKRGLADAVRVTSGVAAIDAASGAVSQMQATMPTVRTVRPPSFSTLPVMGFGRNPGRAAAQHFSEEEIAQLVRWYHDGAGKIINKVKGKGAAAALIKMKLHDPGDEDIKQFQGKYAQRISAWFGSYHRVVTKRSEQAKRAGCAEKAAEGVLTADEAKAAAAKAAAKKAKGPPRKKPKRAGASGSGVAGPAATVAGMTSAPTAATHVTPSTKKRKAPAKPTAQLSGAPDSGAAVLPLPAPMRVDADEMMPSTQAPQKAPTPSRKKAKLKVEESTGAADVTAPMLAALGVVDDATAPHVRSDDAVPTGRTRRPNAGKHGNTARLPAATTSAQHKKRRMSAYDEIRAIEAAAAMMH